MTKLEALIKEMEIQSELLTDVINRDFNGQIENNCSPNWDKIYSKITTIEIFSKAIREQILNNKLEYLD